MPVDNFIDITFSLTDKDLQDLDRRIDKAKQKLQSNGVFNQNNTNKALNFATNPTQFVQNLLLGTSALAGVGFILQVTEQVLQQIQRVDRFFKQFVDLVDTRVDQLQRKETRAQIKAGQTQFIISTVAGSTNPRDAYNSFEQFNNNRAQLEADFAIRNTSGYE